MFFVASNNLVDAMLKRRQTFTTLANAANLSTITVARLAKHGGNVRLDTLGKLVEALEVDFTDLIKPVRAESFFP